jgi:hypothetical protein
MKKDSKQRLFEVMGRLDKTFKPKKILKESIGANTWNVEKEYELPENQITFTIEGSVHSAEGDPSMGNTELGDWDIEWYDLKEGSYNEEYVDIIKEWMAANAQTIKDDLEQAAIDKSGDYGDYLAGQESEHNSLTRVPMKEDNYGRRRNPYDDNDEDDPDAGHTVNGKLLSPEEYRRWKEEEGEYDDTDRNRYRRR